MANKSKKASNTAKAPTSKKSQGAKAEPMPKRKKIVIISVSSVLIACIAAAFVIGLIAVINKNKSIDYFNDDLSKYIYISEEDYKNYPVNIKLVEPDSFDVQREVNKLLVENKNKTALFGGAAVHKPDYAITLGDVVNIWYRGYTTDENGIERDVTGASNFSDSKAYGLEIGSGTFIPGIEEGLVGKYLQASSLNIVKNGRVMPNDVIYISYDAFLPDGSTASVSNQRVVLMNENTDTVFGTGFSKSFLGVTIGETISETKLFRVPGEEIDTAYYNLKVEYAVRCESEPIKIQAEFPADYHEASLRGLEVTFDVYASTAIIYDTPEWNDAFVTDTLKESAESLAEYSGAALTEKYEDKLLKDLILKAEETNKTLIEEEMWKYYHSKVEVKKLPENEVDDIYRQYFQEVQLQYSVYGSGYDSFDAFARYYFSLASTANWREYITERAELAVTERLIFYYIVSEENLIPTDEEYQRLYNESIDEYMEYYIELYETELAACKTEEERAAKLDEIKQDMLEYYGEEYFEEIVYYGYALDFLISYADIK